MQKFNAQPDPTACNVRIEGVAPGASLVGLDVFGSFEDTTESNFLEAINYAVETDHVNVINESFGSNPFPDVTALDATKLFDDAAVAAGVTVTVSSGDAGSTSTIGSPSTDPNVISVGGSTDDRCYAQTNYAAARYFATTGWLDNNISALSSGGFNETGGTVSLVAPAELSWASCSTDIAIYTECIKPEWRGASGIEEAGGTSESSPLTAGVAALVIQAYRNTHGGASPDPGAGQADPGQHRDRPRRRPPMSRAPAWSTPTRRCSSAESINGGGPHGATLLKSVNSLNAIARPGTTKSWPVTVTNTGAVPQLVTVTRPRLRTGHERAERYRRPERRHQPAVRQLPGHPEQLRGVPLHRPAWRRTGWSRPTIYPGNPTNGLNARVRHGPDRPEGPVRLALVPAGRGQLRHRRRRRPDPGHLDRRAVRRRGRRTAGPTGPSAGRSRPRGSPRSARSRRRSCCWRPARAGPSRVTATTPSSPGDADGSIVFTSNLGTGGTSTIPVTLRSEVDVAHGGAFSGTLTGGNGRSPGEGQDEFYEFHVGHGVKDITANVSLANDASDPVARLPGQPGRRHARLSGRTASTAPRRCR